MKANFSTNVNQRGLKAPLTWLWARSEILVPLFGLPVFFMMVSSNGGHLTPGQVGLVAGLAAVYAALVISSPMVLPAKQPQPFTCIGIARAAKIVLPAVAAGFLLLSALSLLSGKTSEGKLTPGWALITFLLVVILGSVGTAAENQIIIDLFPEFRSREARRILYVLTAALFVELLVQFWGHFFGGVAQGIGRALGEALPEPGSAAASFDVSHPLALFLNLLIGAGLFEELLFRVGIMTSIWALTRRWWAGLLVSALLFGLYHISPLSGMSSFNLSAPVTAVLISFGMGLASGVVYRYRGFALAVLTHAVGDWLIVLLLASG